MLKGQHDSGKPDIDKRKDSPQVFALQRGETGWRFSRREFLAAAIAASAAVGCGSPAPAAPVSTSTPLPIPTAGLTMSAEACQDVRAHTEGVNRLRMTPDGKFLLSGAQDNTFKLWSVPRRALLATSGGSSSDGGYPYISPDGSLLVVASISKSNAQLWSMPDGKLLKTLPLQKDFFKISAMPAISPDWKFLVSGSTDNSIKLWSLNNAPGQGGRYSLL